MNSRIRSATSHPSHVVIVLTFALITILVSDSSVQNMLTLSLIWTFWAASLNIIWGYAGQFSMAQVALGGLSAYVTAVLAIERGWPVLVTGLVGVLAAVLTSAVVGLFCLRQEGFRFAIMTLAFALAGIGLVSSLEITGKSTGLIVPNDWPVLEVGPVSWDLGGADGGFTLFMLAVFVLVVVFMGALLRRPSGRGLLALREDALLAESLGLAPWRARVLAFVLSAGVAGFAGVFQAKYYSFVYPSLFSFGTLVTVIVVLTLGGRGTLLGPLVGGVLYAVLTNALHLGGDFEVAVFGALVIVITIYSRNGLASLLEPLDRWLLSFVGARGPTRPRSAGVVEEGRTRMADHSTVVPTTGEPVARPREDLLVVRELTKSYGGVAAVDSVSFQLRRGEILGLIGPNGAGKTTLFNLLSGFVRPDQGSIAWDGRDITRDSATRRSYDGLVRTFQQPRSFAELTVAENLIIAAQRRAPLRAGAAGPSLSDVVELLGLEHVQGLRASQLSYGDTKRLGVALAVARSPELLLLDEPAAGLPSSEVQRLSADLAQLRAMGCTICVVEHHMDLIMQVSDRIMVLDAGRVILIDEPDNVAAHPEVIDAYLGESL